MPDCAAFRPMALDWTSSAKGKIAVSACEVDWKMLDNTRSRSSQACQFDEHTTRVISVPRTPGMTTSLIIHTNFSAWALLLAACSGVSDKPPNSCLAARTAKLTRDAMA